MYLCQKQMKKTTKFLFCVLVFLGLTASSQATENQQDEQTGQAVTVQDTVNATLRSHHSLKAMQENREATVQELHKAKAGWGPRVDITGRGGASQLSNSTTRSYDASKDLYGAGSIGITLTQPLWDGLATRSRVHSAQATVDSMSSRVLDNATSLGLDGLIAHISLRCRRTIDDLARKNVQRHEEILDSAAERQTIGADTLADVTQTQGRLARARSTLSEATATLRQTEEAYRRLTNRPVPSELEPVSMPEKFYENPQQIMDQALLTNPKLAAYQDDIRTAKGQQELAKSTYHPAVNLEVGPSYSDRGGHSNQWTSSMEIMGTVRWNIFNSGADEAEFKAAAARTRQSREVMYSFVDDLRQQIEDTWTSLQSAQEQFQHYSDAIEFNTSTRDAYQEQFLLGERTLLDVLDAESELFNSCTQAATAESNILIAAWRLYALSGELLPTLQISTKGLYNAPQNNDIPQESQQWGSGVSRQ